MLDNVTINQLRAFVAVCDQGSFSGAARELRRAQSAISHAIKALESAFDVELFERNTRKATLTLGLAGTPCVLEARPERWVEKGEAPARVIAAHSTEGKVDRTRPLCPYPQVARYNGAGSIDEASNFTCRLPR